MWCQQQFPYQLTFILQFSSSRGLVLYTHQNYKNKNSSKLNFISSRRNQANDNSNLACLICGIVFTVNVVVQNIIYYRASNECQHFHTTLTNIRISIEDNLNQGALQLTFSYVDKMNYINVYVMLNSFSNVNYVNDDN